MHFLIKSDAFVPLALADTHDGQIRVWHRKFKRSMPKDTFSDGRGRGGGRGRGDGGRGQGGGRGRGPARAPWPKDRPDFLKFVLYKENVDTTTAAKDVCRAGRLNPKRGIGYAGEFPGDRVCPRGPPCGPSDKSRGQSMLRRARQHSRTQAPRGQRNAALDFRWLQMVLVSLVLTISFLLQMKA